MSRRSPLVLIADMFEATAKIERYVAGMGALEFLADDRTIDAVVRNLEVIGEAAGRLPASYTGDLDHIPWPEIVGLRNRIVHEYFGIDLELVWVIIHRDLPKLAQALRELV